MMILRVTDVRTSALVNALYCKSSVHGHDITGFLHKYRYWLENGTMKIEVRWVA